VAAFGLTTHIAVTAVPLAPVQLVEVAVDSHKKDIQACQQPGQIPAPGSELNHALHDQVVASNGKSGQVLWA
jgi:hypothetical protein